MKGKLLFVAGIGVGFVLGARAGRGSYERLKSRAEGVWHDPKVQQGIHDAGEYVKDNAPVVAGKAKDAAAAATGKAKSAVAHGKEAADKGKDAAATAAGEIKDRVEDESDSSQHGAS